MRRLRIDDPLDAFAVHGACGLWGLIAVGLFTVREYSYAPHEDNDKRFDGDGNDLGPDSGIFMPHSRGLLFGTQIACAILEILWVCTMSTLIFGSMKLLGIFRVSQEEEDAGADISKHGGSAYHDRSHRTSFYNNTGDDHTSVVPGAEAVEAASASPP